MLHNKNSNEARAREQDQLISFSDIVIHENTTRVRTGASLTIDGVHHGALHVEGGAVVQIRGTLHGSLYVGAKASVGVWGSHCGPIRIAQGGTVRIEQSGHVDGTMHVDGILDNHGRRTGSTRGTGSIRDHRGSSVYALRTPAPDDSTPQHHSSGSVMAELRHK